MNRVAVRKILRGSSLAVLGAVSPAYAQGEAGAGELENIIVTARRVEERVQDVPISITVFNQQQLTKQNVVNSSDLAAFTPSLSANSNFGNENSSFAIRGFVQDLGTLPSVGVYFADVVAPRGSSNGSFPVGDGAGPGSFFDLQNVQVLKGPQGTLFGRNTTGGAVLLVPQRPTHELGGYVQASAGNLDMQRLQGVVNAPLGDKAALRLGIDQQTRDGYVENTSGIGPDDFGDVDYTAYRASLTVELTPDLENYAIFSRSDSRTNGVFGKLVAADAAVGLGFFGAQQLADQEADGDGFYDARQDLANPLSDLQQWQLINTTTWQVHDDLTFKNIISYAELTQDLRSAMFGTAFVTPALGALLPSYRVGFASIQPIPGGHTGDQSTFTEEMRLDGAGFDNALTWQTGAYVERSEPLSAVGSQSPVAISCTDVAALECTDVLGFLGSLATGTYAPAGAINYTSGKTEFNNVGLYAQGTYQFSGNLALTAGLRYTWDRQESTSTKLAYQFNPPLDPVTFAPLPPEVTAVRCANPDAPTDSCTLDFEQETDEPTWLIGLDYTPADDMLLYAKYARGYRAGTIASDLSAPFNYIRPERVDAYEIGSKFTFHGTFNGIFNAAVFFNDFENQQLQLGFNDNPADDIAVAPTAGPVNAGASEIYGVELEAAITPFEGFTIEAGYTYLNTEITEMPVFTVPPSSPYVITGKQQEGDELALSPEHKYTISARYTLPLDESMGEVTLGVMFIHTDEQLSNYVDDGLIGSDFEGLSYLPETDIVNANLSWDSVGGSAFDLLVFGTNLTDEEYFTFVPGLAEGAGFETAQLGLPRMYGVQLRYRFGN